MNRREFIVGTMAAAVATALAGTTHAARAAENFCRGCGGSIWRGTRAYVLAPLGRDEQEDYCVSCLAAMDKQQLDWEEYITASFARSPKQAPPCRRDRTGREPCR